MNKSDLIKLLKEYKENKSKWNLALKEIKNKENTIKKVRDDIDISSSSTGINNDIHSKNSISDKTGKQAIDIAGRISALEDEIQKLKEEKDNYADKVDEVDIRLKALTEKEYLVVYYHYIEDYTYAYIGDNQYFNSFKQTRSEKIIKGIAHIAINKMAKI